MIHNIHDGFCITCEDTVAWLSEWRPQDDLALHGNGGVVVWVVRIPGVGDVDEVIAPTYSEARPAAQKIHGDEATVIFSHVRHAMTPIAPSSAYVHTGFEVGAL